MASTASVRMKRRVTPNTAAQALNLFMEVVKGREPLGPVRELLPTSPEATPSGEKAQR